MGERVNGIHEVRGSIPLASTRTVRQNGTNGRTGDSEPGALRITELMFGPGALPPLRATA